MTREEIFFCLIRLSKRTGFSCEELDYIARMIAQAAWDPLPPVEWGEPFEFARVKVSMFEDECDITRTKINGEVPKPNAQMNLLHAFTESTKDADAADRFFKGVQGFWKGYAPALDSSQLPLLKQWLMFRNQWDWA